MNLKLLLPLLKPQLPSIINKVDELQGNLKEYLDNIPLDREQGETHATVFLEESEGKFYIVVGVFNDKTFSRMVKAFEVDEYLMMLPDKLKSL